MLTFRRPSRRLRPSTRERTEITTIAVTELVKTQATGCPGGGAAWWPLELKAPASPAAAARPHSRAFSPIASRREIRHAERRGRANSKVRACY
jgi:hypothetical protein